MSTNPAWKQFERRVAQQFSTMRNPLSGGNSKHSRSDSLHDSFFISCKYSAKSALFTLFQEEAKKALHEKKIPILCSMKAQAKHFLVTVASTDLTEFCMQYLRDQGHIIMSGPSIRKNEENT